MNDVDPRIYTTVLREMIRHENDLTNHRIMWLLIGQGLIANAYVGLAGGARSVADAMATVGILLTLSTYLILYKSYHARGYLEFLGEAAKTGTLPEPLLPLLGWPARRVKDWRKKVWVCAWLGTPADLLEPYLFLPTVLMQAWTVVLVWRHVPVGLIWTLPLCAFGATALLLVLSVGWVRRQQKDETETLPGPG